MCDTFVIKTILDHCKASMKFTAISFCKYVCEIFLFDLKIAWSVIGCNIDDASRALTRAERPMVVCTIVQQLIDLYWFYMTPLYDKIWCHLNALTTVKTMFLSVESRQWKNYIISIHMRLSRSWRKDIFAPALGQPWKGKGVNNSHKLSQYSTIIVFWLVSIIFRKMSWFLLFV